MWWKSRKNVQVYYTRTRSAKATLPFVSSLSFCLLALRYILQSVTQKLLLFFKKAYLLAFRTPDSQTIMILATMRNFWVVFFSPTLQTHTE